ncbi:MAG: CBS domain-containing protein [Desulfuromonadaceae bacterium]|nr:CBS domain-containing protein [Desulfuromonadaceae bacterium]
MEKENHEGKKIPGPWELTDEDVMEALEDIPGYVDITPTDFKAVFNLALRHAVKRLRRFLKASDIMTRDVITVTAATPVLEVAELMAKEGISGVPVLDPQKKVIGVISEKDLLRLLSSQEASTAMQIIAQSLRLGSLKTSAPNSEKAGDIMTSPPVTVRGETPVQDIGNLFSLKKINRAPVVDDEGKIVGIVSRDDIVRTSVFDLNVEETSSEKG